MSRTARIAGLFAAGVAAAVLACAARADAQDFTNPLRQDGANRGPCVLDKCAGRQDSGSAIQENGPSQGGGQQGAMQTRAGRSAQTPGDFDFYVLALSWSPDFCDTGGDAKAPRQCAEGTDLGFVVHGLWPQYAHGFPSACAPGSGAPSRAALESVRGIYPDEGLARYEWRQHGTCTGLSPADYFALVRRARERVTIPAPLQAPHEPQTFAPLDIARAFIADNPGLRTDTMAVTCRQDELQEVRICFTKDLRGFATCPEVSRAACRTRQVSVLPVR